jgi:uncharacterized repeat protein (TIGR01451 family)
MAKPRGLIAIVALLFALLSVLVLIPRAQTQPERGSESEDSEHYFGDEWSITYGGSEHDRVYAVAQTADDEILVAGLSRSDRYSAISDGWLAKHSADGRIIWHKAYGHETELRGATYDIEKTSDGGFVLAGLGLRKVNASGDLVWQRDYDICCDDLFSKVIETEDGGLIAVGTTRYGAARLHDIWVAKFDHLGTVLWEKNYGTDQYDYGHDIIETGDGGFIIVGDIDTSGAWIIKINGDGSIAWQKRFLERGGRAITSTSDGAFVVVGRTHSLPWVIKINSDGETIWQKAIIKSGIAESVIQTSDDYIIVAGATSPTNGTSKGLLFKLDLDGNFFWKNAYDTGGRYSRFFDVLESADGGYIMAGESNRTISEDPLDFWLVKVNSAGEIDRCPNIVTAEGEWMDRPTTITDTNVSALTVSTTYLDSSHSVYSKDYDMALFCPVPEISISKTGPERALSGDPISYTLSSKNNTEGVLTGIIITDALPSGAEHLNGGTLVGDIVSWTIPSIAPEETINRQFAVKANYTITNSRYCASASEGYRFCGLSRIVTEVDSYVYFPLLMHRYCPPFFDDFSNPATGWPVGDDDYVTYGYANGEYRVKTKQSGYFYLFRSPSCDRLNYFVQAEMYWVGTPGSSYGLIFDVTEDYGRDYIIDKKTQ